MEKPKTEFSSIIISGNPSPFSAASLPKKHPASNTPKPFKKRKTYSELPTSNSTPLMTRLTEKDHVRFFFHNLASLTKRYFSLLHSINTLIIEKDPLFHTIDTFFNQYNSISLPKQLKFLREAQEIFSTENLRKHLSVHTYRYNNERGQTISRINIALIGIFIIQLHNIACNCPDLNTRSQAQCLLESVHSTFEEIISQEELNITAPTDILNDLAAINQHLKPQPAAPPAPPPPPPAPKNNDSPIDFYINQIFNTPFVAPTSAFGKELQAFIATAILANDINLLQNLATSFSNKCQTSFQSTPQKLQLVINTMAFSWWAAASELLDKRYDLRHLYNTINFDQLFEILLKIFPEIKTNSVKMGILLFSCLPLLTISITHLNFLATHLQPVDGFETHNETILQCILILFQQMPSFIVELPAEEKTKLNEVLLKLIITTLPLFSQGPLETQQLMQDISSYYESTLSLFFDEIQPPAPTLTSKPKNSPYFEEIIQAVKNPSSLTPETKEAINTFFQKFLASIPPLLEIIKSDTAKEQEKFTALEKLGEKLAWFPTFRERYYKTTGHSGSHDIQLSSSAKRAFSQFIPHQSFVDLILNNPNTFSLLNIIRVFRSISIFHNFDTATFQNLTQAVENMHLPQIADDPKSEDFELLKECAKQLNLLAIKYIEIQKLSPESLSLAPHFFETFIIKMSSYQTTSPKCLSIIMSDTINNFLDAIIIRTQAIASETCDSELLNSFTELNSQLQELIVFAQTFILKP